MAFEDTVRATRNAKLSLSDVELMQILDKATSWSDFNSKRGEWLTYRQALRDLPASFPEDMDDTNIPAMPLSPTEQATLDAENDGE
tara:strand:+ start:55 stop:312 length:258 start_codon:yes stop_codon:yes gene_type:complete